VTVGRFPARRGWLAVFAKAPRSGEVKTRLCPPFSHEQAAALYRCLLADGLEESAHAARALGLEPVLAVDPPEAVPELAALAPPGFRALPQRGADLGARMAHVARQAAASGAPLALLRGSDSPTLARAELGHCVCELGRTDLVVGPDRDGGYHLLGLGPRALSRAGDLFDHPMSTPTVLRDTVARAERAGLSVGRLETGFDLDSFEDLRWLADARHRDGSIPCQRTLGFLDEQRLWPARSALDARRFSDPDSGT